MRLQDLLTVVLGGLALWIGSPFEPAFAQGAAEATRPQAVTPMVPPMLPVDAHSAPPVRLRHIRTDAHYTMILFDSQGQLRIEALSELRAFLTDPRTQIDHPIHWRLATLLVAIAASYPGRSLEVVSGYRHESRHAERSNHTRGRALDFRVDGVDNRELFERLRQSFGGVGVGYYPNSLFVHLDVRDDDTIWVDYSTPGKAPCYSRTPAKDLKDGTAERTSYEEAKARGCKK